MEIEEAAGIFRETKNANEGHFNKYNQKTKGSEPI